MLSCSMSLGTHMSCMLARAWYPRLSYLFHIWTVKLQKFLCRKICFYSETYLETVWTSMTDFFCENNKQLIAAPISQKSSVTHVRLGYKYASGIVKLNIFFIYTHLIFVDINLKTHNMKLIQPYSGWAFRIERGRGCKKCLKLVAFITQ